MNGTSKINWEKEALDFLVSLYPLKRERDFTKIYVQSTEQIVKFARAREGALVRLEDKVTARVLYASGTAFKAFIDPAIVQRICDSEQITVEPAASFLKNGEGDAIFIPVKERGFTGVFILILDDHAQRSADFQKFLEYAHVGLKNATSLIEIYYSIEELSTRFNAILETIPEGVVFVDDSGKNAWVNATAADILNVNKEKNEPIAISQAMVQLRNRAINQEEILREGSKLFSSPNQSIKNWKWIFGNPVTNVLSVSCVPAASKNITGRLWVFSDITFAHLANEQLNELNIELAEKRRIADDQNKAKSDFLANMSHEIRTPMNGVIGMTSLLTNTALTEEQQEYVDVIRVSGEALLSIINDILDFSKIESGKLELEHEPFYIHTVIEETYDLLSIKANEKKLDLLYSIDHRVPAEIIGDVTRVRQILVNLVSNGIKFTERGEILVEVSAEEQTDGSYLIKFLVEDTGIGIPEDKYYRLFESFSQVDSSTTRKYGGTGLGLAICQRLVTLMGGGISVQSEVGKGSKFTFTIKAQANKRTKQYGAKQKAETQDPEMLKGKRILVLDDNKTNLKILKAQSEQWGMDVQVFDNYRDTMAALEQQTFDVAIIDMLMPEKDGLEVATMIKSKVSSLPLVLFSSSGQYGGNSEVTKALFAAVLHKPTKHSQLQKTLIEVVAAKAEKAPDTRVEASAESAMPISILVAEDNEFNQKLIARALEKLGYTIDLVENGLDAVNAVKAKPYQLVFMDVMMPQMDGFEATRLINRDHAGKRKPIIIATTANALSGDRERTIEAGMEDYISKPFKLQDLKDKIDKWKPQILEKL